MKKLAGMLFVFLLVVQAGWGQYYTKLAPEKKKQLAEAYYLVGSQYEAIGKKELGKAFMRMAITIYPELQPEKITEEKAISAAELLAQGKAKELKAPEEAVTPEELLKSYFLRLIGSFLDEDAEAITEFIDGSVYISKLGTDVARQEARSALDALFQQVALSGMPLSKIYDLTSERVLKAPASLGDQWGEVYLLQIDALIDLSSSIQFWETHQQFFIRKVGNTWRIFAIGRNPPPASWTPQPVSAAARKPERAAPLEVSSLDQKIQESFIDCISAFLKKDLDSVLSHVYETVDVLRLDQTITSDELRSTFQGYFEVSDFRNIRVGDLIDLDSAFVELSSKFADRFTGAVYLLSVKTKLNLSDRIPFWTTYQDYYFIEDRGAWKIFAIF